MKTAVTTFTQDNWTEYLDTDPGYAVIKSAVALYDMNAFFCDQQVAETFLSLAMLRESVVRRAKELGYAPFLATASTCSVQLTFSSFGTGFIIPAGSSWLINNIPFQCLNAINIAPNTTTTLIPLTQGTPYTSTSTSAGVPWAKYVLPITASNIVVTVNGTVWTAVDTFIEVPQPTSYKVYEDVGGQTISFGLNLAGLQAPNAGDTIVISALLTSGATGNIFTSGLNVSPQSVIRNSGGANVTGAFNGVSISSAIGGADVESTQSIRVNAPAYYGTQGRAVSASDYTAIVKSIPGIKDAQAVGGETLNQYGTVFISVYGSSPYEITGDLQTQVLNILATKGMLGLIFIVNTPQVVEVQQVVSIGVSKAVFGDASVAVNNATAAINAYFSNLLIGANLYESAESAQVEDLNGIIFTNIATTVDTFAGSSAGIVSIPVCVNADITSVVLTNAVGTVLFTGDATSKMKAGVFIFDAGAIPDQKLTLSYSTTGPDVKVTGQQIVYLTNLTVNPTLV
jgi:hypothetical protein